MRSYNKNTLSIKNPPPNNQIIYREKMKLYKNVLFIIMFNYFVNWTVLIDEEEKLKSYLKPWLLVLIWNKQYIYRDNNLSCNNYCLSYIYFND